MLRAVKVEVDVQALDELCDGVPVRVGLLLDHLDEVLEGVGPVLAAHDHSGGEVAQDVRTHGLDCVQVVGLVQEHVN